MADILHRFPIRADASTVFDAITSPTGLNAWWTLDCEGEPAPGAIYRFYFAPEYDWYGVVTDVAEIGRAHV